MSYKRVLPRDAYNEAKLLKCIGRLVLNLEATDFVGAYWSHGNPEEGFCIEQTVDGDIWVSNFYFSVDNEEVELYHPLNSKEAYPLQFCFQGHYGPVFEDDGTFSKDFWGAFND